MYHSVFDNYAWFTRFADPTFVYEQQQARVFGLEVLHIADADVLPYDYVTYAKEIGSYLKAARCQVRQIRRAAEFCSGRHRRRRHAKTCRVGLRSSKDSAGDLNAMNAKLRQVENDMLDPQGLPAGPGSAIPSTLPANTRDMRPWSFQA